MKMIILANITYTHHMTKSIVFIIAAVFFLSCKKTSQPDTTPKLVQSATINQPALFPANNPWNTDISGEPVDPNSANLIAHIGLGTGLHPDFGTLWEGKPIGIPYNLVGNNQPKVKITFQYASESDPGPYPIPPSALQEASSDAHVLVLDTVNKKLYELYAATRNADNSWNAGSGAVFDVTSNTMRPDYWTSADAAGLPILPGLVRYDEVVLKGAINHALRFTVNESRNAFVHPATHAASDASGSNVPPMGMRVRLKASVNITSFPAHVQVILKALKKYGMFVADNGSDWFISGAPDPRWDDEELSTISGIKGSDFEVVKMGTVYVNSN